MSCSTEKKLRMTRQLSLIKDELNVIDFHPTAEEIYNSVRKLKPDISLGTVYRNLEKLVQQGEIVRLNISNDRHHYDGNPLPHQHFHCRNCGVIKDIRIENLPAIIEKNVQDGFQVERVDCSVVGVCSLCK